MMKDLLNFAHQKALISLFKVRDLIEVSNIETNKFRATLQPFCLKEAIYEIIAINSRKAGFQLVYLTPKFEDIPETITSDKVRLQQVI